MAKSNSMDFIAHAQEAFETSRDHGFHDSINGPFGVPLRLALIMTECSEAIAEYRRSADLTNMPDSLVEELADIYIRLGDLCAQPEIGLERFAAAVTDKLAFNKGRPHRHGNRRI